MSRPIFLASAIAITACSSGPNPGNTTTTDAGTGTSDSGGGDAGSFVHDLVLTMNLTVKSGEELHQCQLVKVPAGTDYHVTAIAHQYTTGSHHFLLYKTALRDIPSTLSGQYDCTTGNEPIMRNAQGILYAAQSPTGGMKFPAGVGFTIPGGSVFMIQVHYLNATAAAINANVNVGFDTAPAASITTEAGFIIMYDPFIDLPARSKAVSGIRCPVPKDITLMTGFSHYHKRGTSMNVFNDASPTTPAATAFYQTSDWEHPLDFVGPKAIKAGSTIRFECNYDNSGSDTEIFQGPNVATSEMCVFAGLYYPRLPSDFETCQAESIIGTGTKQCSDVAACVEACPAADAPQFTPAGVNVGPCWERCVASGCDGAVDKVLPLFRCVASKCAAECAAGGCTACATSKCTTETTDCYGHVCK